MSQTGGVSNCNFTNNLGENVKVNKSEETFTVVMELVKVSKRTLVIFLWFSESPPLESFCFVE